MNGRPKVAKLLIERGADVDSRDRDGRTPLITASECGQLEVARLLLDHGVDVNTRTRNYSTALHHTSYNGNFEMVRLLLEHGANVNIQDANRQTPKQLAEQRGCRRIVESLPGFGKHGQEVTTEVRFVIQVTFDSYRIADITTVTTKATRSHH